MDSLATVYRALAWSRMRSQLQYRTAFAFSAVASLVISMLDFFAILLFFQHVRGLGGWSFREIAFLYGTSYAGMRLADITVGHVEYLPRLIRAGTLDVFLMRPLGSLFQVLTSDFTLRQAGGFAQGVGILAFAIVGLDVVWTPARAAMVAVMIVAGYSIFVAIWIGTNAISFWLIDTREISNAFTYGGSYVSQFPLNVFGGWLRRLLTVVIPVAFINYYPALYVLGKPSPYGALRFASPAVAVVALAAARVVWRAGIRHYRGTGS